MKQINDEKAYDLLRSAGFTVLEINCLIQLRLCYTSSELDQIDLEPMDQKEAPCVSPLEKIYVVKSSFANVSINILKSLHSYIIRYI